MRIIALAAIVALGACTVERTDDAQDTAPGEVGDYEVRPADVDIDWDTAEVRVPNVELEPRDTVR